MEAADELPHSGLIDEWVFAAWLPDATLGFVSGHRLLPNGSWYWCAVVEAGRRLLHLAEFDIARRSDPFILKAPEMWAEHQCDEPMQQWSIGNEAYFVALDEPAAALHRPFGIPTALAIDAEWYAAGDPTPLSGESGGYHQTGVVHGEIELLHRPNITFEEIPGRRWRRWGESLGPLTTQDITEPAPTGIPAPFAFPDGSASQWTLTASGWHAHEIVRAI